MTLLEAPQPWKCGPFEFAPGRWIMEAATAAGAMFLQPVKVQTLDNTRALDPAADYNDGQILVVRSGGFGDLLFLTPLLRAMKQRWPQCRLHVATTPVFQDALAWHPSVDEVIDYPLPADTLRHYDAVLWLEGVIEFDPRAKDTHYVDLLSEAAGIPLTDGRHLNVGIKPEWRFTATRWPKRRKWRIGVQAQASARCRTWPHVADLVARLSDHPHMEVMIFGAPEQRQGDDVAGIHVLPWAEPEVSFGESLALLETCDVVVAPDSAICHAAAALRRPVVALYGSFPWQLRTAYQPTVRAINGHAPCAPCQWHAREGAFPPNGPCRQSGRCDALATITVGRVVSEVGKKLN